MPSADTLLILPHLHIQNANAISSPLTWGFPAMSAFIGLMHALERKLPEHIDLELHGVGVICHNFDAQVTTDDYTGEFHLTRNPVKSNGETAAIAPEGRAHLEVTLIFAVHGATCYGTPEARHIAASEIADIVASMRVAGGSVIPAPPGRTATRQHPNLTNLADDVADRNEEFKRMRYSWLPGFALVSRHDLLKQNSLEFLETNPPTDRLDAWLSLFRLNTECQMVKSKRPNEGIEEKPAWSTHRTHQHGWVVPIPVGYGALSELAYPGTVTNARDFTTPFRFVESLYSVGEWISPARLKGLDDLIWYVHNDTDSGLYQLRNDYRPAVAQ